VGISILPKTDLKSGLPLISVPPATKEVSRTREVSTRFVKQNDSLPVCLLAEVLPARESNESQLAFSSSRKTDTILAVGGRQALGW
jgi:hypothetical protein